MTEKILKQTKSEEELRKRMQLGLGESAVKPQKLGYGEQELRQRMQSELIENSEEPLKIESLTIGTSSERALRKRMQGELEAPPNLIETAIKPQKIEDFTGGTQSEQDLRRRMQLELREPPNLIENAATFISRQDPPKEVDTKEKTDIERRVEKIDSELNRFRMMGWGEYIGSGGGLDPNKISEHLIPTTANTYDLGSTDRPWRDIHLSGATLVIGGTELAAGELTVLDNITAGTVSASKAVIVDSSKDITGFRNVNAVSYSINGTAIASTAAELNILDGVTSTAAELNILDGVTSTTAELNIVDGVTSTTAELNILDGVTSTTAELNIVDGVTATTAELNILDVSTASGASTSTFLRGDGSWQAITGQGHTIQNAGSNLSSRTGLNFDGTYLIGTDDSGSNQTDVTLHSTLQGLASVTSTAAELNIMDGVTSTTAELNILDGVTSTASELNINDGATLTTDEINLLDISTAANASTTTFLRGDGSWQSPTGGGASLAFKTFSVSGQSNVVADDTADTLTFIASGDTTITTNAGNDSITIDTTVTTVDGGNF